MSNLKSKLKRLNIQNIKLKSGRTIVDELKYHAAVLADCIISELDGVYDSYTPKVWRRDYSLYNSLCIDDFVEIRTSSKGTELSIKLYFDEGAYHDSFDGQRVNTAVLINEGWQTHGSFKDVPYLGYRSGEHFIEKGIERYKSKVKRPFAVKLTINNEERM